MNESQILTLENRLELSNTIIDQIPDLVHCADCGEYVPLDEAQMFGDGKYYCIDGCEKRVKWFC